jgi:hypothetical protein
MKNSCIFAIEKQELNSDCAGIKQSVRVSLGVQNTNIQA